MSSSCCDSGPARASSTLDFGSGSLYTASAGTDTLARSSFDSRKGVTELVQEGSFVQSNRTPRLDQNERAAGEQPKIIVSNDASVTPDYIVRQDGKVEVVGNPDNGANAQGVYRVQVEAGADPKTTDALVSYLNDRIHQKEPSAEVSLLASPGLVSEEVQKNFNTKPAPEQNPENPNEENPPPEDDYPSNPGGGGCPGGDCPSPGPEDSPEDSPAPTDNPLDQTNPMDNTVIPAGPLDSILDAARLNNWDNNTNGSLGAYEVGVCNWFSSWLDDEMMAELGNPPDFRKLGKVLAKAKNNPKFKAQMSARLNNMREQGDTAGAEKIEGLFNKLGDEKETAFAENFGIFLNGQRPGGRNATGEEMANFFDKDLQKAIASSRMSDIAHAEGVKLKELNPEQASKMALAGALGHMPSPQEIADYNKYVQSVQNRYKPKV